MDYSDLGQLWTFCYSREDTYIKIIAAILDFASHLERLIQKIEWHFVRHPAIGAFTLKKKINYFFSNSWHIAIYNYLIKKLKLTVVNIFTFLSYEKVLVLFRKVLKSSQTFLYFLECF